MRFRQAIWAAIVVAFMAATSHVGAQLGLGLGAGEFSTRVPDASSAPPACGGYHGPGDVAPNAKIGAAIRAWTAALCGNRFANITVSGVSADMLTSATTGALVPQTINGSVCPNASTTLCVVTKWYDQPLGNNCTGSCDFVKTSTEQLGVLTTTCPLPLTACIVFPTSTATFNQVAGNFTPTSPLTVSAFTNYTFGGAGSATYVGGFGGAGGGATLGHASVAGTAAYSCDGATFPTATAADGSWFSSSLLCGTSTMQLFLNGVGQGSQPLTPNITPNQAYVGGIFASGPTIYETEVGIWNSDVSGQLAALNANQRAFYGFVIAGDSFFDSVAGSDANNCTSSGTACQTVAKMKSLNYTGGHAINWKGGSSFTGCLVLSSGNVSGTSAGSPITIQQYSTGAAPILTGNCGTGYGNKDAVLGFDSISVVVNGIKVVGPGFGTPAQIADFCVASQNSSGVGTPTVIFENLDVTGCDAHLWTSGFSEIKGFPGVCGNITTSLLNNTTHGVTQLSFDGGGVGGSGCGGVGNDTVTSQGNLYFNIGGNPSQGGNDQGNGAGYNGPTDGSVFQFELAHDNGGNNNACGGPFGLWQASTINTIQRFSEVYNEGNFTTGTAAICDGGGFDLDVSTTTDIVEYVYSHHNFGPGFLMFVSFNGNTFRYSISENDQWSLLNVSSSANDGGGILSFNQVYSSFFVYNNTVFSSGTGAFTQNGPACWNVGGSLPTSGITIANNACWNSSANSLGSTLMVNGNHVTSSANTVTVFNNDYYYPGAGTLVFAYEWNSIIYNTLASFQSAEGLDNNSISTNPSTGTWTAAGTCTWTPSTQATWPPTGCPTSYSTVSGAVKGTGAAISNPGTRDYYANTVPRAGPLWNMGAYGGP